MGTNAQIPLMVNTPQPESPLKTIGGLMQLRSAMTENALRAAQTQQAQSQAADLSSQAAQRQQEFKDAQTAQQIMGDPKNAYDIFSGNTHALDGKVSPLYQTKLNSTITAAATNKAELRGKEIANDKAANDKIQETFDGLNGLDPAARVAAAPTAIAGLREGGYLKHLPGDLASNLSITTGSDDEMKTLEARIGILKGITDHAAAIQKTQAETAQAAAKGKESTAKAAESTLQQQILQHKLDLYDTLTKNPGALESRVAASIDPKKYPNEYARAMSEAMNAPDLDGINAAISKHSQNASEQDRQISVATNPDVMRAKINEQVGVQRALENVSPNGQLVAKGIANYQIAPLGNFALARPQGQAIMAEVERQNPQYQAENYNAYQATEKDAVTGKIATSANALNTMMGHLSVLDQAAGALKNGNVQALNSLANSLGVQFGATPKTTYDTIVHRLGPEVTKAYLAAGGSVGERGTNEEDFSSKQSPDQIKNNIAISAKLADSKIAALQDQYQRGTYGHGQQRLITPDAEAARKRLAGGGGGNTVRARDPQGKLHEAPAGTPLPSGWKAEP